MYLVPCPGVVTPGYMPWPLRGRPRVSLESVGSRFRRLLADNDAEQNLNQRNVAESASFAHASPVLRLAAKSEKLLVDYIFAAPLVSRSAKNRVITFDVIREIASSTSRQGT
jgi:hypothetical protein